MVDALYCLCCARLYSSIDSEYGAAQVHCTDQQGYYSWGQSIPEGRKKGRTIDTKDQ